MSGTVDHVIFISDGHPTVSNSYNGNDSVQHFNYAQIAALAFKAANPNVTIHAVGMDIANNPFAINLMKNNIATTTSDYYQIDTAFQLPVITQILDKINADRCNTPLPGCGSAESGSYYYPGGLT